MKRSSGNIDECGSGKKRSRDLRHFFRYVDLSAGIVSLMATFPVTSCECERLISVLKLIKTSLRSTMTQDRLNGLAMMHYHRDIDIDPQTLSKNFHSAIVAECCLSKLLVTMWCTYYYPFFNPTKRGTV